MNWGKLKLSLFKFVLVLIISAFTTVASGICGVPLLAGWVVYFVTGHLSVWSSYLVMIVAMIAWFYLAPRHPGW